MVVSRLVSSLRALRLGMKVQTQFDVSKRKGFDELAISIETAIGIMCLK